MYTEHCPCPIYLYISGSSGRSLKHGVRPKFFAHLQFADDKTNATETNGRVVIPRFFFFHPLPHLLFHCLSLFCFGFIFFNAISREVSASGEPNYSRASIKKKKNVVLLTEVREYFVFVLYIILLLL